MRRFLFVLVSCGSALMAQGQGGVSRPDTVDSAIQLKSVSIQKPLERPFYQTSLDLDPAAPSSLSTVLQSEPGVAIKANGAGGLSTLSIGGFGGNHTALMWNGVNLQNTMNGFADLRTIPTFLFSEIDLQTSAMASPGGGGFSISYTAALLRIIVLLVKL